MMDDWSVVKQKWDTLSKDFFKDCYFPSLLCCIFVELCSRRSVISTVRFLFQNPLVFLYNSLIIAATVSVCLLFRKRAFVRAVLLFAWAAVGVTDFVLLSFRTTPFTAVDLLLIKDAFKVANRYLSTTSVVLLAVAIVAVVVLCVYLFQRTKREEGNMSYGIRIPFCLTVVLICLMFTKVGMETGLLDRNFGNIAQAFHDNGLPYCFMNSLLNTGVERPEDYSSETMGDFLNTFEAEEGKELVTEIPRPTMITETITPVPSVSPEPTELSETVNAEGITEILGNAKKPNVIFLQLESFFDVKYIDNFSCSEDPVPFFTCLKEKYPSGFLEVPSIGAGTANTEFECITGMNLDFFGPGEYPYKTILKERTCESMAYILKQQGYSASAMHNNDGTFYGRNVVFSNLGFDRYISVEYMENAEVNPLNWAKDRVLVGQIMDTLEKTEERDYIYAISVQGHGAYPEEPLLLEEKFNVKLPEELTDYYYQYLYYVHQLWEMDLFIKELVLNLSAHQEETVLVLYGDHLPSLGLSDELLINGNAFQTEYVIWSNFDLEAEDKDIQSYQLTARVLELLGMEDGIMPQYHIYRQEEEDYLEKMQLLMYDMLYGDRNVYEGGNPYEPTTLQMGLEQIVIRDAYLRNVPISESNPVLCVVGENFTEWSKIAVDGEETETVFLNNHLLITTQLPEDIGEAYIVTVRQQGSDEKVLSETEPFSVSESKNAEEERNR